MRESITVIKGNFRKNKGVYFGVFLLMFVVSMTLTAVFSILLNSRTRDREAMEEAGFGDVIAVLDGALLEKEGITFHDLTERVRDCDDLVSKADEIPALYIYGIDLNGSSSNNSYIVLSDQSEYMHYNVYDDESREIENPVLKEGEICVPICLKILYDCEIGDYVTIKNEEIEYRFTIASYFEDPYMGSSMMGIKTVLISSADFEKIYPNAVEQSGIEPGVVLSIFKKDTNSSDVEFEKKLNSVTRYGGFAWITLSRSQAFNYMLLLINIFSGILVAFVVMLVVVTLIVLSRNISSNIEQDYVNYGILKAIGMTNNQIKGAILCGYGFACLLGALLGLPTAIPVIGIVNSLIRPATGLYAENTPAIMLSILAVSAILITIVLVIGVKLIRLNTITPVAAINGGRRDVYFSSLLQLPISKKMFSTSLAYRQLTSGKKQYLGAVVITSLLVLFLVMMSGMCIWLGDGEALKELFAPVKYDLSVRCASSEIAAEVETLIQQETFVETNRYTTKYILLNDSQIHCTILEDPSWYQTVYQGRTCTYNNEILITEYVANNFDIDIGDSVQLSANGVSEEYIVSGIYQCANDAGKNMAMSRAGYSRLTGEDALNWNTIYRFADESKINEVSKLITDTFNEDEVAVDEFDLGEMMDVIVGAVNGIAVLIYVIAGIFVIVTVVLNCGKILARERQDYGIYKAIGFTARSLRSQFAIRFVIVSIIGSLLGILLSVLTGDAILTVIFASFGLANASMDFNFAAAILPIGFMAALYYVFSYLVSKKIKKVSPRELITE